MGTSLGVFELNHECASIFVHRRQSQDSFRISNNLLFFVFQVRELSYELDEFRQSVPDLEDKILGLQAETESTDKALR